MVSIHGYLLIPLLPLRVLRAFAVQSIRLHYVRGVDAEEGEGIGESLAGGIDEGEAGGAGLRVRLHYRARTIEIRKALGEFVDVGGDKEGLIPLCRTAHFRREVADLLQ